PAVDPLDRLLALWRNDIGGGEDTELVEDRISELGVLLAGGETPHSVVHRLMIPAHENVAAWGIKFETFHGRADLLIGRPSAILRPDGFFDRSLQPIKRLRHEGPLVVRHAVELRLVAPEILAVSDILVRIGVLKMIAPPGESRALGKNLRLAEQASC